MSTAESESWSRSISDCLDGPGGEVSARARAASLARTYRNLDREARRRFLTVLAQNFGPSPERVEKAIRRYQEAGDDRARVSAEGLLRDALRPPRRRLLTQFNELAGGVKFLVEMRSDLLTISSQNAQLSGLDEDLKQILVSWFDFGFLELERITWRSPATLLEKLISYEAVHEIRSWDDLRNRLESDRRCYALFHPSMQDEPLAFVEVALCNRTPGSVQALLDANAPTVDANQATTAVFYSISSPQKGLRGISFGEYLIKRSVDALSQDLDRLERYETLSPIPGFRVWLERRLTRDPESLGLDGLPGDLNKSQITGLLARRDWASSEALDDPAAKAILALCARYFAERRADGQPLDPVARFHLRNGASLDRIHCGGDISGKGIRQSLGLMVNYRYALEAIDTNHEAYAKEHEIIVSSGVHELMLDAGARLQGIRVIDPR